MQGVQLQMPKTVFVMKKQDISLFCLKRLVKKLQFKINLFEVFISQYESLHKGHFTTFKGQKISSIPWSNIKSLKLKAPIGLWRFPCKEVSVSKSCIKIG